VRGVLTEWVRTALPVSLGGQLSSLPNRRTKLAKGESLKNTEKQALSKASLPDCPIANSGWPHLFWEDVFLKKIEHNIPQPFRR
jgi:hypothetical protein